MLTEFVGNVNAVEAGQIFVIAGKTIDAASRFSICFRYNDNALDHHFYVRFFFFLSFRQSFFFFSGD